ncbi:MAG TPA: TlyA family RNA methyltransferase [Bauldia sp.]|nr:TlyA family RNA methyltransferase [Bauldia sp.]
MGETQRLDVAMVERGLVPTRARARDAILRGHVTVAGKRAEKAAQGVDAHTEIAVDDPAQPYVARSALKLIAGLDHFGLSPEGRTALDIGASTGGFTQVLLERGARRVYAIDVGHDQLHPAIAADPRVISREGLNARDLSDADLGEEIGAVVADVSFISLRLVLPAASALAARGAWGVFLAKPQFEVGPANLGKGGVVRDTGLAERAARDLARWIASDLRWQILGVIPSPIDGGDGNREFLIGARRD